MAMVTVLLLLTNNSRWHACMRREGLTVESSKVTLEEGGGQSVFLNMARGSRVGRGDDSVSEMVMLVRCDAGACVNVCVGGHCKGGQGMRGEGRTATSSKVGSQIRR